MNCDNERSKNNMMKNRKTIHLLSMAFILILLWVSLSGYFKPLLLSLGAFSILLVLYISKRMELFDFDQPILLREIYHVIPYWIWLIKEIVLSNFDVIKRILNPALPINPQLVNFKSNQKTDFARVNYANSITLTPGTISIDIEDEFIEVHALSESGINGLASGEMDKRITHTEAKAHA